MPNPSHRRPSQAPRSRPFSARPPHSPQAPQKFELVDPVWILKALAATLAFGLLVVYLIVCVVFSRTQWQLVLQPSRNVTSTPAALGMSFTEVHFGVDSSGQPQLDGWWIPSPAPDSRSVIVLHSGSGSISGALSDAQMLHAQGLNVLLFDYRGFGHSGGQHPSEALMQDDAQSAFLYLTGLRNVTPTAILIYGEGVGGSLAVRLCARHSQIAGLILKSPDGDLETRVRADVRSVLIPVGLLFNQDFPLAAPLRTLPTPKLLISFATGAAPQRLQRAADPKTLVVLPAGDRAGLAQSLHAFLLSLRSR